MEMLITVDGGLRFVIGINSSVTSEVNIGESILLYARGGGNRIPEMRGCTIHYEQRWWLTFVVIHSEIGISVL